MNRRDSITIANIRTRALCGGSIVHVPEFARRHARVLDGIGNLGSRSSRRVYHELYSKNEHARFGLSVASGLSGKLRAMLIGHI